MRVDNQPHEYEDNLSSGGSGEHFAHIMERRMSRRTMLKGGAALSGLILVGPTRPAAAAATDGETRLTFTPIEASTADEITVAEGYRVQPLLKWGDPILPGAPAFDLDNITPETQAMQAGYNCDFVGFFPLPAGSDRPDRGLLVVNHEYTNAELMFRDHDSDNPTQEQVDVELAAHGLSVVEIRLADTGEWQLIQDSAYNRRITGTTPIGVSGPAAGDDRLKRGEAQITGTLNNCSAGKTPWGTVLSAEENFHQYFANLAELDGSDERKAAHERYGIPAGSSRRRWEDFYARYDVAATPDEPFRFGWVVEIDPYDPGATPVKRTALGRVRHEAATATVTPAGRVAVYSGDDSRFEYVYKFVSARHYDPDDRQANMGLLDEGTLYVAKLNDDGSGEWLPLVWGEGPLQPENGFRDQADVLLRTREAADALGATKMDRPEDIEVNPANGKVYMALTNNTSREDEGEAGTNAANPRPENRHGHVIELTEADGDHASATFDWEILLLCGDPEDEGTYFAGYPKDRVSAISCPDNIAFDRLGNLWITTDGQPDTMEINDSVCVVPVSGEERGYVRRFLNTVPGAEVAGPELTPDDRTLFLSIQHPGQGSDLGDPDSTWPDGEGAPRPTVIAVRSETGGVIGIEESSDRQSEKNRLLLPYIKRSVLGLFTLLLGIVNQRRFRRLTQAPGEDQ